MFVIATISNRIEPAFFIVALVATTSASFARFLQFPYLPSLNRQVALAIIMDQLATLLEF